LIDITRRDVESYVSMRRASGLADATVNRELCCLKNMLSKAVDWNYLETNPAWGVKQRKENPGAFDFLRRDELDRFLSAVTPTWRTFFTLAVYTGMRKGELLSLRWENLDLRSGIITVPDSKNGDCRYIPMNTAVRDTIICHPKRILDGSVCSYVFSNKDGRPRVDPRTAFRKALELAGIERNLRIHDLRHTFASILVMEGVDLRTIANLLGHRDIKMTMRYAHLAPEHLKEAVEKLLVSKGNPEGLRREG